MGIIRCLRVGIAALLKILTLGCAHCTRLDSDGMDRNLGLVDRLAQLGHRLSCGPCRKSAAIMKRIDAAARDLPPLDPVPMPADTRDRIAKEIQKALKEAQEAKPNQHNRQN